MDLGEVGGQSGGRLAGVRPPVTVDDKGAAKADQTRQAHREGDRALRCLVVGAVLHDEVEAPARPPQRLDRHAGLRAQEREPRDLPEPEPALGEADDDGVALDGRHVPWRHPLAQQVQLRSTPEADKQDGRARRQAHHVERLAPVLLAHAGPVAVERVDRQHRAVQHELPVGAHVDHLDESGERRSRPVEDALVYQRRGEDQRGAMRMTPSSRIVSAFSMTTAPMAFSSMDCLSVPRGLVRRPAWYHWCDMERLLPAVMR
jgi:hypothetical protein